MVHGKSEVVAVMDMRYGRYPGNLKTVESLKGQVDTLYLLLINFPEVPQELNQNWIKILHQGKDVKGVVKFTLLKDKKPPEAHVLGCHDNVEYPQSYVQDFLATHKDHPDSLLTHHGFSAQLSAADELDFTQTVDFRRQQNQNQSLDAPGEGVMFIPNSIFAQFEFQSSINPLAVHIHLACLCLKHNILIIGIAHPKNYLKVINPDLPNRWTNSYSTPERMDQITSTYKSYGFEIAALADRKQVISGSVTSGSGMVGKLPETIFQARCKAANANLVRGSLNVRVDNLKQALALLGKEDFTTIQADQPDNPLQWWQVELILPSMHEQSSRAGKTFVIRHQRSGPDYLDVISDVHIRTELNLNHGSCVQLRKITDAYQPRVVAAMCMWHPRYPANLKAVRSLEGQVDTLYLCLNDFQETPPELCLDWIKVLHLGENLGDWGKLCLLRNLTHLDAHVISCDDDFKYPPSYVDDFLAAHKKHPNALLTHHGGLAQFSNGKFERHVLGLNTLSGSSKEKRLAKPGTGVSFIPKHIFNQMQFNNLVRFNQMDVHLACNYTKLGVPMIGMTHPSNYLVHTKPGGKSIHGMITPSRYIKLVRLIYASYDLSPDSIPAEERA